MIPRLNAQLVDDAAGRIDPFLSPTPLRSSTARPQRILLKLENEQPTGSFKVRGALSNLLAQAPCPNGFVTASAGNHGLGVAFAASVSGRSETITVFVPTSAPERKIAQLRAFKIDLRVEGATYDDAAVLARKHADVSGARYIHAYDDPLTAAGQGTVACELAAQTQALGAVFVPVGGGGLITGIAAWLKERKPEVRVIAVQPVASPALRASIDAGRALHDFQAAPTLADGLAGGIGDFVFEHRNLIDEIVVVDEAETRRAIKALWQLDGVRAEASGAVAYAAAIARDGACGTSVAIITGGNIDDAVFDRVIDAEGSGS